MQSYDPASSEAKGVELTRLRMRNINPARPQTNRQAQSHAPRISNVAENERAKDLGRLLANIPKYGIAPTPTYPVSLMDKTYPQDKYLVEALQDFNTTRDAIAAQLDNRANVPISLKQFDELELEFLSKAAHSVRAAVAYSGESNNAGNMRQDFSLRSSISNTLSVFQSRAPLILAPLALKVFHEIGDSVKIEERALTDKLVIGAVLAVLLPIAANDANHRFSESNGGHATKVNFDFAGVVRHVAGRFAGTPHGPGPGHWGTAGAALSLLIALSSLSGIFNDKNTLKDDSWTEALTETAVAALINLVAVSVYEAAKQTAIGIQNHFNEDHSAQMAERMDHRRNKSDVFISQTTFKSNRSRTQGIAAIDTPRGRARLITTAGSIAAGVVAGGLYGSPTNSTAFARSFFTFTAANLAKWVTEIGLTQAYNHPKKTPELSSLATSQIRVDDIRQSAMEPYVDFSVGLANGVFATQENTGHRYKSAKDILYQSLSLTENPLATKSWQAASGGRVHADAITTQFDIKPFAATTFLFDDQKFGDPNSASKLHEASKILKEQLGLFKKDFAQLKADMKTITSGTNNHLKRQFDYIEKSTRACEEMVARFQNAVEEEYDLLDAPNVGGTKMTFASQSGQSRPQGFHVYRQAREAMMAADPSTSSGRSTIEAQQEAIASFCCGPLEGVQLKDIDLSKIPNTALGVAAVAVRETLKAEIYELHTRSMLLASNLTIQDYLNRSGVDINAAPDVQGNNGAIPQLMESALYKLLPIHTGIVSANFEDVTRNFLSDLEKLPNSALLNSAMPKDGAKSKAFHVLSREAGMRPNIVMLSDSIIRQINSDAGTASKETGELLHTRLELLRDRIDDVSNNKVRSLRQFVKNRTHGIDMREDGIEVPRVKARLDFALNRIASETNKNPSQQGYQQTDFSSKHRPFLENLDRLEASSSETLNILSRDAYQQSGRQAGVVIKEDFVAQLKEAFGDMTRKGAYRLSITKFLEKLDDKLGPQPNKLASLKAFISEELPETKDFFEIATTELNYIVKNPFQGVMSGQQQGTSVTVSTAGAGAAPAATAPTDFKLIETQLDKLNESLRAADGDVKTFWDGNLATPVQASGKELALYKLADTHRHQSAFANQHENLVDSYQRMMKIGIVKSVIMPIPTLLNHGGGMVDYYTSGTYGISYSPSPKDQREGLTANQSQGAALLTKDSGEQALVKQLGDLHKKRVDAQTKLDDLISKSKATGKRPSKATDDKVKEFMATIAAINDVFDFYVLSTTVADTADRNKRGMEERILGQFAQSKEMFGSYLIKMMGENTFNKTNVNSRQPVDTNREAVKNAIMTAAQLGRPFNLHSDAARPGDKKTWFNDVKDLIRDVSEGVKALDRSKRKLMEQTGHIDAQIASNFKLIWSHAGGIAADARDSVDHLLKLRSLMDDSDLGKHVLVDISWDKTYSVVMKNFQDYLAIQTSKLDDLPAIKDLPRAEKIAAKKLTRENLKTISRLIESFALSMDNFSSATTKAHLANLHGLDQTAALSRVAASTPFDLHKEQLANFKDQFEVLFKSDAILRAVFMNMIEEAPSETNNNWMGFFVNHSDKIMFGTDALVPHTKVTGEMQYQLNALNYYPFFNMIDVMTDYYGGDANPRVVADGVDPLQAAKLEGVTDNITHATFEKLLAESNFEGGNKIIDEYHARNSNRQMATANTPAILEEVYKQTLVPSSTNELSWPDSV